MKDLGRIKHSCTVMQLRISTLLIAIGLFGVVAPSSNAATPNEVLVVINDSSPTSRAIGTQYVNSRHTGNVLHVQCVDSALSATNETIDVNSYRELIEKPIRLFLQKNPKINYIVLTKGIPIRVVGGETGEAWDFGSQSIMAAKASVDGTLAALGYDTIPGAVKVTFNDPSGQAVGVAWLNRYWNVNEPFSHKKFGGYLVTRLDGFTEADALALTQRALSAERGIAGGSILLDIEPDFGVDDPSTQPAPIVNTLITQESPFSSWNADMLYAGNALMARGIPVTLDSNEEFVGGLSNLMGYFSWGSNDDHFSQAAYNSLSFAPGAVGDTAVSTSASSMLPPGSGQSAIGDLIAQGITGVKGYIDEPLLQAISSPTIVLDRYTRGFTLAESFYSGSHFLGWTDLVIGDPLSHPYPSQNFQWKAQKGEKLYDHEGFDHGDASENVLHRQ